MTTLEVLGRAHQNGEQSFIDLLLYSFGQLRESVNSSADKVQGRNFQKTVDSDQEEEAKIENKKLLRSLI